MHKTCSTCKIEKPLTDFGRDKNRADGHTYYCKQCLNEKARLVYTTEGGAEKRKLTDQRRREKHRETIQARARERYRQDRKKAIDHYGGVCACCGEKRFEFLAIDHINGEGNKHRKEVVANQMVRWLIKSNFPEGFRILCHNCNLSIGFYGYCPHHREKP